MPHFPKPFFKKSHGRWYVQIDGRQVSLGSDREEAFRQYHRMMQSPSTKPQSGQNPLVVTLADAFLDWVEKERAPETFEWYRFRLQRFCEQFPDLQVETLRPLHLQQWLSSYPKLSRTSRRNYLRSVKTCLTWALQQGYIEKSPIAQMPIPNAEHREVTVSLTEYEQLLQAIVDPAFRDLVVVTWETGCRPQESLRVEARHVDLQRKRWVFPKSEAKGKRKPRIVYLTEAALEITARRMKENPSGPIFRNSEDNPWTTDAVNCAFTRVQFRMGKTTFERHNSSAEVEVEVPKPKRMRKVNLVLAAQLIDVGSNPHTGEQAPEGVSGGVPEGCPGRYTHIVLCVVL